MAVPDYIGAMIVRLRADTNVTALCPAERITAQRKNVPAKSSGVVLSKSGGAGSDPDVPLMWLRVDVKCYGANELAAVNIWRTVHHALEPATRHGIAYTAAGCRVMDTHLEAGPVELVDPDDDSPFVFAPYRVLINEVAVA